MLAIPRADLTKGDLPARVLAVALLVICVFDPANRLVNAKTPVFVALWAVTLLQLIRNRDRIAVPLWPMFYVFAFIGVPALSILGFYLANGNVPPQGFPLLKAYLLVSLTIPLILNRLDLVPSLSMVLTAGACLTLAAFAAIAYDYGPMYNMLQPWGLESGMLYLDERDFGRFRFLQVYFTTSPMMVIAVAHYFDKAMSVSSTARKAIFAVLAAVNTAAIFVSGLRNNMIVALLLPLLLWPLYTSKPRQYILYCLGVIAVLAFAGAAYLQAFFDPNEFSNNIKLTTLRDYLLIFSDPATLMLGQGLGANYDWTARGQFFITELTYLETIRNFGLFGALIMFGLLSVPLANAMLTSNSRHDKAIAVAYFMYLVMSATNPNFFSSMGVLILAILLANIYQAQHRETLLTVKGKTWSGSASF
jgi:hypothetical protein